ncbi:hypothetical protein H2248_008173 [Termitomyces sp. 'cryptogamus']|nr:hypothetical protein H2248_008173 [Termitomyces sp. 'cryptogamus']
MNREQVLYSSPSFFFDVEDMLFHGTTRSCLLVEDDFRTCCCGNEDCSLCEIVESSFDIAHSGAKNSFSRFGAGVYTTSCSSKADDYVHNEADDAVFNVMLVCRVVSGRRFYPFVNMRELAEPPPGFHSVQGDPDHHRGLNYPETVVYDNDAIRPAYLIVYEN